MPLSIEADLTVTVDDTHELRVTGTGSDTLTVHLPSLRVALAIWRKHREAFTPLLESAPHLPDDRSVSLLFVVKDVPVAVMGKSANAGWLARLLGIAPIETKPANALRVLFS